MSDCGNYDNTMANTLGLGVIQAYNYYTAWNNDEPYQITLGQYQIQDIISVHEATSLEDVPWGFTAYGSFSGSPPFNNLVILRGTQTGDEALFDMDWSPTPCILNGNQYGQAGSGVYDFYTEADPGFNSLQQNIKAAVQNLANVNYPSWYFAAHSLGGALITLAAMDAVVSGWYGSQSNPTTTVYTYGSLHVGDQDFATAFANNVPQAYRVANLADWVPSLVGLEDDTPGYVHVGLPVTFLWQKDMDWANHSMQDTYLNTIQNYSNVLKCGPRTYPQ
jgi:predicted lipase